MTPNGYHQMGVTVEAIVKPELLKWARITAGYDTVTAARKIPIALQKLEKAEAGLVRISFAQLRRASEVYKRPLALFYLPEPPAEDQLLPDFRLPTSTWR